MKTANKFIATIVIGVLFFFMTLGVGAAAEDEPKYPDLVVTNVAAPSVINSCERVSVTWTVENQGDWEAYVPEWMNCWNDRIYLSEDGLWDDREDLYRQIVHKTVIYLHAGYSRCEPLYPGESYTHTDEISIPNIQGRYYLVAVNNIEGFLMGDDSDWENNQRAIPVTIKVPDLVITDMVVDPTECACVPYQEIWVSWTVENQGNAEVVPYGDYWRDSLYLSTDTHLDHGVDIWIASDRHYGTLDPSRSYSKSTVVAMPCVPEGQYYILLETRGT